MRGQLPSSAHVRPRWTDALLSVHKQHVLLPSPPVWFWLSGPQTGGDVCSLRRRQLLFLPPLHLSTSPLICWRRWHLPQSGLNVCAPVGGSCPGRNFDGGGASRGYCVNANGHIYVDSQRISVCTLRSKRSPVHVPGARRACRGILVQSKRSRSASVTIVRDT